jgi:hypothetical protein
MAVAGKWVSVVIAVAVLLWLDGSIVEDGFQANWRGVLLGIFGMALLVRISRAAASLAERQQGARRTTRASNRRLRDAV